jgi:leader peptidase (prepilin peptidase) / N-methyltransferase
LLQFPKTSRAKHNRSVTLFTAQLSGPIGRAGWALLLAAPFVGSFLGVLIRRLPEERPIAWARSACEACGATLRARDLVPLFSWAVLGGRCRHCGERIGWFYPAVELAALAVAALALLFDRGVAAWVDAGFGWWLLTLAWIDAGCFLLPDALTLPLVLAGLADAAAFAPRDLLTRSLGAIAGYAVLQAVAWAYRRLRGREGLGGGDAKLLAAAGAWVGVAGLPSVILLAAGAALAVAFVLQLGGARLHAQSALPFGPFLALGMWVVWMLGPLAL